MFAADLNKGMHSVVVIHTWQGVHKAFTACLQGVKIIQKWQGREARSITVVFTPNKGNCKACLPASALGDNPRVTDTLGQAVIGFCSITTHSSLRFHF